MTQFYFFKMLIWTATIILLLMAVFGWLFLRKNSERYLHGEKAPIDFFFQWGNFPHYLFKIAIIILFMLATFSFYKYLLSASNNFSLVSAVIAGVIIAGGKELLDKYITIDDVIVSVLTIILGALILLLLF